MGAEVLVEWKQFGEATYWMVGTPLEDMRVAEREVMLLAGINSNGSFRTLYSALRRIGLAMEIFGFELENLAFAIRENPNCERGREFFASYASVAGYGRPLFSNERTALTNALAVFGEQIDRFYAV